MLRLLPVLFLLLLPSLLTAEPPRVIDDEQIIDTFIKRMTALTEDNNCPPLSTLREQLKDFQPCTLKLPSPRRREISDEDFYSTMCRSIAIIGVIAKDESGMWIDDSVATAWIATEDGALVTNYHVIDGPADGRMGVMLPDGSVHPVRSVLASSKDADVAVVKIDATGLTPLALAQNPPVMTPVRIVSHPDAHFFTLTIGHVSRYCHMEGQDYLTVTADVAVGSSGAPVLDRRGNVVGMVCMTQTAYTNPEEAPLELQPEKKPETDAKPGAAPEERPAEPADSARQPSNASADARGTPPAEKQLPAASPSAAKPDKTDKAPEKKAQGAAAPDKEESPYPAVDPQMVFKHCITSESVFRCFSGEK